MPLDTTERALLAQIANGNDAACDVLADHWVAHGDARGTFVRMQRDGVDADGTALLAPARALGFEHLRFARGFLAAALVVGPDDDATELLRLSPMIYRELGRAKCNGRIFDARVVTAAGEGEHALLKTVDPQWPTEVYDDDIVEPKLSNRRAMYGYVQRREDERNWGLALRGGVHLSNVLGVRSVGDPEHCDARPRGRALGLEFALSLAHAVCGELQTLNEAGEVHDAVTPENILLDERGDVRVLDLYPSHHLFDTFMPWAKEQQWYLAPELVRVRADPRANVFSIALVACTLIEGVHPYETETNVFDRIEAMQRRPAPLPELPPPIESVLRDALAPLDRRTPTPGAFADAIARATAACRIPIGADVLRAMSIRNP